MLTNSFSRFGPARLMIWWRCLIIFCHSFDKIADRACASRSENLLYSSCSQSIVNPWKFSQNLQISSYVSVLTITIFWSKPIIQRHKLNEIAIRTTVIRNLVFDLFWPSNFDICLQCNEQSVQNSLVRLPKQQFQKSQIKVLFTICNTLWHEKIGEKFRNIVLSSNPVVFDDKVLLFHSFLSELVCDVMRWVCWWDGWTHRCRYDCDVSILWILWTTTIIPLNWFSCERFSFVKIFGRMCRNGFFSSIHTALLALELSIEIHSSIYKSLLQKKLSNNAVNCNENNSQY